MIETRFNEMNMIYIQADYDNNTVKLYDMDMNELPWIVAWNSYQKRKYPAIISPTTGKPMLVHRLVAYTFKRNQFNALRRKDKKKGEYHKYVVHHKDNNPYNPFPDNLEWTTQSDNIKYSYEERNQNKA